MFRTRWLVVPVLLLAVPLACDEAPPTAFEEVDGPMPLSFTCGAGSSLNFARLADCNDTWGVTYTGSSTHNTAVDNALNAWQGIFSGAGGLPQLLDRGQTGDHLLKITISGSGPKWCGKWEIDVNNGTYVEVEAIIQGYSTTYCPFYPGNPTNATSIARAITTEIGGALGFGDRIPLNSATTECATAGSGTTSPCELEMQVVYKAYGVRSTEPDENDPFLLAGDILGPDVIIVGTSGSYEISESAPFAPRRFPAGGSTMAMSMFPVDLPVTWSENSAVLGITSFTDSTAVVAASGVGSGTLTATFGDHERLAYPFPVLTKAVTASNLTPAISGDVTPQRQTNALYQASPTGTGFTYQWQRRPVGGSTWSNIGTSSSVTIGITGSETPFELNLIVSYSGVSADTAVTITPWSPKPVLLGISGPSTPKTKTTGCQYWAQISEAGAQPYTLTWSTSGGFLNSITGTEPAEIYFVGAQTPTIQVILTAADGQADTAQTTVSASSTGSCVPLF